jgi:hypothetical protein
MKIARTTLIAVLALAAVLMHTALVAEASRKGTTPQIEIVSKKRTKKLETIPEINIEDSNGNVKRLHAKNGSKRRNEPTTTEQSGNRSSTITMRPQPGSFNFETTCEGRRLAFYDGQTKERQLGDMRHAAWEFSEKVGLGTIFSLSVQKLINFNKRDTSNMLCGLHLIATYFEWPSVSGGSATADTNTETVRRLATETKQAWLDLDMPKLRANVPAFKSLYTTLDELKTNPPQEDISWEVPVSNTGVNNPPTTEMTTKHSKGKKQN